MKPIQQVPVFDIPTLNYNSTITSKELRLFLISWAKKAFTFTNNYCQLSLRKCRSRPRRGAIESIICELNESSAGNRTFIVVYDYDTNYIVFRVGILKPSGLWLTTYIIISNPMPEDFEFPFY